MRKARGNRIEPCPTTLVPDDGFGERARPRAPLAAPSRPTVRRGLAQGRSDVSRPLPAHCDTPSTRETSLARPCPTVGREGATHGARGGRAPHRLFVGADVRKLIWLGWNRPLAGQRRASCPPNGLAARSTRMAVTCKRPASLVPSHASQLAARARPTAPGAGALPILHLPSAILHPPSAILCLEA